MTQPMPPGHEVIAWRGPWTRITLAVLGLIAAASAAAIIADATHHTTLRSWATGAAVALGLVLFPAVKRADLEGVR